MPRAAHLIAELAPRGRVRQLLALVRATATGDESPRVFALRGGGELTKAFETAGGRVTSFNFRGPWDLAAARRLRIALRAEGPEVLHAWDRAALRAATLAASGRGAPPLVARVQLPEEVGSWPLAMFDRLAARRAAAVVVTCEAHLAALVAGGLPTRRIALIPGGVPLDGPEPGAREALLAASGLPPGARVAVAAGRLVPDRRLKDLIWAADLLQIVHPDFRLVILGEGPQRARLEKFREQTHTTTRVHFLGRRVDAPRLIAGADYFWQGRASGGFSLALAEAMAAARPVIVSDTPGHRGQVTPGESGLMFRVGDRAEIARHTSRLLGDPAEAAGRGAAAREAAGRFPLAAVVSAYRALEERLTAGRSRT